MAPRTRTRASAVRVPNDAMCEYYRQRAVSGLIFTEATSVSPQGVGYPDTPGIWSHKQVLGWRKITRAVHDKGGKIFLQLWHVGRVSDPEYLNGQRSEEHTSELQSLMRISYAVFCLKKKKKNHKSKMINHTRNENSHTDQKTTQRTD